MENSRNWEDMNIDCLVNIFGRVGIESLALDVPFVCKSWYKATLNPQCWQSLVFPKDLEDSRFGRKVWSSTLFVDPKVKGQSSWFVDSEGKGDTCSVVKGAVNRSQRSATTLALPYSCDEEELIYALEECPALKFLILRSFGEFSHGNAISSMINKLKNLEGLLLQYITDLEEILLQISLHCKNFVSLHVLNSNICSDAANAIVTLLPDIKYLVLKGCVLGRSNLVIILNGCQKLVHLDVSYCQGFESDDEDIPKLASHITTFKSEGSYLYDDYDFEPLSSRDVDFEGDYGSDYYNDDFD